MVVIVIMGILAAVAVPKLFGMIAKSKASEVPTAAGTWINMQDAYFQEKGQVGNWQQIGYSAPGEKKNTYSYTSNVFAFSGNETCGGTTTNACEWVAKPKTKLNDCTTAMKWQLNATNTNASGDIFEKFTLTDGSSDNECLALTASWTSLQGTH